VAARSAALPQLRAFAEPQICYLRRGADLRLGGQNEARIHDPLALPQSGRWRRRRSSASQCGAGWALSLLGNKPNDSSFMSEPPISRGFRARRRPESQIGRVPPGQHVTADFPVLSAGPTPQTELESWSFALFEGETLLAEWSWSEFEALPQAEVKVAA